MLTLLEEIETPRPTNPAALMVRIVDSAGRAVLSKDIATIHYSIYKRTSARGARRAVKGYERVLLKVSDVFFDTLQMRRWTVDVAGYNFRHIFDLDEVQARVKPRACLEIEYELIANSGEQTALRFQLRAPEND